ncbi:hypothetical protein LJR098_000856 [Rhizobium sp. LjRoot98]|uniref:hypothetical protein n=1 Tax=Rhizobium sp. LjRoot98 TaxID=3342345 RepID=UPI003ECE663E
MRRDNQDENRPLIQIAALQAYYLAIDRRDLCARDGEDIAPRLAVLRQPGVEDGLCDPVRCPAAGIPLVVELASFGDVEQVERMIKSIGHHSALLVELKLSEMFLKAQNAGGLAYETNMDIWASCETIMDNGEARGRVSETFMDNGRRPDGETDLIDHAANARPPTTSPIALNRPSSDMRSSVRLPFRYWIM